MNRLLLLLVPLGFSTAFAQEGGKIIRPLDGSVLPVGEIHVLATAIEGRLEFDDKTVQVEEPFPNVFQTKLKASQGEHSLSLFWEGGNKQIRFWARENLPESFKKFVSHPPTEVECTLCHSLSRRGRFRFTAGSCFSCHVKGSFISSHWHAPHIFEQCGQCHNAHGSTTEDHLVLTRETACGLCHSQPDLSR